jgi:hypothetical protein
MHKLTFTYTTDTPSNIFGKYETLKVNYRFDTINSTDHIMYNERSPVDVIDYCEDYDSEAYTEYYFGTVDGKEVTVYTSENKQVLCSLIRGFVETMPDSELSMA